MPIRAATQLFSRHSCAGPVQRSNGVGTPIATGQLSAIRWFL